MEENIAGGARFIYILRERFVPAAEWQYESPLQAKGIKKN